MIRFLTVFSIFTIYAAVLGLVKFKKNTSNNTSNHTSNSQEVMVLLQDTSSRTTPSLNVAPFESSFPPTISSYKNQQPYRPIHSSHGPSTFESYTDSAYQNSINISSTDPFDSKLQRLGLHRHSVFNNQGSQSDCVIATVTFLTGHQRITDLYDKLLSMQLSSRSREDLYQTEIYHLLTHLTHDQILSELTSKRQVLSCVGTSNSPLLGSDWNLNRLGVVYNRTSGIGGCLVLEKSSATGTWNVVEVQMDETQVRQGSLSNGEGKAGEFRQNATDPVLLFGICAGEDAERSVMTREARRRQASVCLCLSQSGHYGAVSSITDSFSLDTVPISEYDNVDQHVGYGERSSTCHYGFVSQSLKASRSPKPPITLPALAPWFHPFNVSPSPPPHRLPTSTTHISAPPTTPNPISIPTPPTPRA